jgi:PRC-barrel domain
MAEAVGGALPTLEEALGWVGYHIDEIGGPSVARVQGIQVDAESGKPQWLVVKLGRFGRTTAIPFRDCAAVAGHVWCPYERDVIRGAPAIEAGEPISRELELELCAHYGVGEGQGRAGELAERGDDSPTARPATTPSAERSG